MRRISRRGLIVFAAASVANFHNTSHAAVVHIGTPVDRLRAYFSFLSSHRYADAFSIWEKQDDTHSANGQTLKSFAAGFKLTKHIVASIGTPGDAEGAAGSIFVEVPVTIEAVLIGGKKQVFKGTYVMRSSNMADDHNWYIYRATMKQVH